jgi:very-short-patch-repair endonuclease
VDGVSHSNEVVSSNDVIRQRELENLGLQFLRFDDLEVKRNMSSVLRTIQGYIEEFEKINPPGPLKRGSREEI